MSLPKIEADLYINTSHSCKSLKVIVGVYIKERLSPLLRIFERRIALRLKSISLSFTRSSFWFSFEFHRVRGFRDNYSYLFQIVRLYARIHKQGRETLL